MTSVHRILAPVALSPQCAWSARYAAHVAARFGAELLFLHVSDHEASGELRAFLNRALDGVAYRQAVMRGDAATGIITFAQEQSCDLILMPTHAYGRFRRYLLGSVTAKVLHDADCPVWTGVHHQDAPLSDTAEIHSLVCAVDADAGCLPVIRWAQDLAAFLKATLKIVHAVPAADETSDNVGEIELRRYLFGQAENEFARLCHSEDLDVKVALAGGPVGRVVRETALRERADLVIIGRGHTQRALGRLRTQAYSIIRESPCPVLSI